MAEVTSTGAVGAVRAVWASGSEPPEMATGLLRAQVGRVLGTSAEEVHLSRSCPQCGSSEHGRPVVLPTQASPSPFVSLSRAGAVVVVVVCDCGPVGVDIEWLDAPRFEGFDEVALHPREVAPTIGARATTWVRKESLLKATGDGLNVDPRLIELSDPDQPPRLVQWCAPDPPAPNVWMRDLEIPGCAACVTVLSDVAPRLTLRQEARAGLPR